LLVLGPAKQVLGGWFHIDKQYHWPIYLVGSRLLTLALFCGFLTAVYLTARSTAGGQAAFTITLVLSTSAGILVFNRFLTADSPLLFWMAASLAFAVRSGLRNSTADAVIAALLAGLAAADKYNGLGVAAAIPAALFAARGWRFILSPAPWLAGVAIPAGFLLGCPGALLDTRRFVDDFLYNYLHHPGLRRNH
jgi:4-amino-4-deoxy-L-arabinose transferase-like glycosyltransferase